MGRLTTVTLYNDSLGDFEKDPKSLGQSIVDAMNQQSSEPSRGGSIKVHPSRHADDNTLYIHKGNTVIELNAYCVEFQGIMKSNPQYAKELLQKAEEIIHSVKDYLSRNA